MAISPVSYNNQNISNKKTAFTAQQQQSAAQTPQKNGEQKADEFLKKFENMPPAAVGLTSGLVWFGIGVGLDRLVGAIFKPMKTNIKSSLIWNGVFGAVMGAMAFWRARKEG